MNCTFEQRISAPFFPGCKLDINLPPKDFKFAESEPFCVWTYTAARKTTRPQRPLPIRGSAR